MDVYVHSITDGSMGTVTNTDISNQIRVLNDGFSGREGGIDTGFRFRLAGIDRTNNTAWFNAGPGTSAERAMKKALHRGDASDLNIYLTSGEAFLGWAYFPSTYKTKPWIDGIVIDWESMLHTSPRLRGQVRPRQDGDARGRPLARARSRLRREAATRRATTWTTRRPS